MNGTDVLSPATFSKAIAGGIAAAVVAELARYGFHPQNEVITAGGVVLTAVVSYIVGHLLTYFAPANKPVDPVVKS